MPVARPLCTAAASLLLVISGCAHAGGWRADPVVVDTVSRRLPGFNFEESRVPPYTVPPLLTGRGREAWGVRRAELLELFRTNVYGRAPGLPERMRFELVEENPRAMDGAATLRRVAVISGQGTREHRFELVLFLPNSTPGPVPVFLLLNNRPATNTDPTRDQKSPFWPAEELIARGYGIAALLLAGGLVLGRAP